MRNEAIIKKKWRQWYDMICSRNMSEMGIFWIVSYIFQLHFHLASSNRSPSEGRQCSSRSSGDWDFSSVVSILKVQMFLHYIRPSRTEMDEFHLFTNKQYILAIVCFKLKVEGWRWPEANIATPCEHKVHVCVLTKFTFQRSLQIWIFRLELNIHFVSKI